MMYADTCHNFYTGCYIRKRKIGCPSWLASMRYSWYRLTHRKEFREDF